MSNLKAHRVASVAGTDLSLYELLHTLKLQGRLTALIVGAVIEKLIATAAEKEGIKVSDEELQKAADAFRLRRGLNKAADTQRWLASNRLVAADLEEALERDLVRKKLADHVTRNKVEKYFARNRNRFDRVHLRQIVVDKDGIAQELLSRILEEGVDFADLARQHSLDQRTRTIGGDLGIVSRTALPPVVAAAVFTAKNGDVVGPLKSEGVYLLIKVEETLLGQLDGPATAAIQEILFREWVVEQVQDSRIDMKLEV